MPFSVVFSESIADVNLTTLKISLPREEKITKNLEEEETNSMSSNYHLRQEERYTHGFRLLMTTLPSRLYEKLSCS